MKARIVKALVEHRLCQPDVVLERQRNCKVGWTKATDRFGAVVDPDPTSDTGSRIKHSRSQKRNLVEEEMSMARNGDKENVEAFQCDVCGKICESRGCLGIHRKRMHGELHQLLDFRCRQCNERFSSENTKVNHEKVV